MDRNMNLAAWMIAGGPRIEIAADQRERDQLRALLASRHVEVPARPSLAERIRAFARPAASGANPACCPA